MTNNDNDHGNEICCPKCGLLLIHDNGYQSHPYFGLNAHGFTSCTSCDHYFEHPAIKNLREDFEQELKSMRVDIEQDAGIALRDIQRDFEKTLSELQSQVDRLESDR